mmetsp:Transcript_4557/g.14639  ORF Transcript_4557/g.14639 Transcript_4557/m.14639 type:complete len:498 (-) Transcript_4557:75-1568(-)
MIAQRRSGASVLQEGVRLLGLAVCHTVLHGPVDDERREVLATLVHHLALVGLQGVEHALDERGRVGNPRASITSDVANVHGGGLDAAGAHQGEGDRIHRHLSAPGVRPVDMRLAKLDKGDFRKAGCDHRGQRGCLSDHLRAVGLCGVVGSHVDDHGGIPLRCIVGHGGEAVAQRHGLRLGVEGHDVVGPARKLVRDVPLLHRLPDQGVDEAGSGVHPSELAALQLLGRGDHFLNLEGLGQWLGWEPVRGGGVLAAEYILVDILGVGQVLDDAVRNVVVHEHSGHHFQGAPHALPVALLSKDGVCVLRCREGRHRVVHCRDRASGQLHGDPGDVRLGQQQQRRALLGLAAHLLADVHALLCCGDGPALGVGEFGADGNLQRVEHPVFVPGLLVERRGLLGCGEGVRVLPRGHAGLREQQLRGRLALGAVGRHERVRRVGGHFPSLFALLLGDLGGDHITVSIHHAGNVLGVLVGSQCLGCLLGCLACVRRQQRQRLFI